MIAAVLLVIFLMPLCAMVAGFVVWIINRHQWLDDRELLREFVLVLSVLLLLSWGVSSTHTARLYLDPAFRLQTELDANPVYATIRDMAPDDHKHLHDFLLLQISQGKTLPEALLQARNLLTGFAGYRLGFSDQKTHVLWATVVVDTLKELQARDPALCYQAMSTRRSLDEQTLANGFSADNTAAFQQAIVALYQSADRGMRHDRPADEKPVEFNAAALEYRAVQAVVEQQFGEAVERQLASKVFPEPSPMPPEQMCAARILQLETMLERPQAMASRLLDSVLR